MYKPVQDALRTHITLMYISCGGCKRISAFLQLSIIDVPQQPALIHTVQVFSLSILCSLREKCTKLHQWAQSPNHNGQRKSRKRQRRELGSILPFISRTSPRTQPGQLQAKPGQAEMGRSHASNKSHTDMETPREVLFKQALFHTVSYLPIHGLCHREMMSQRPIMHLSQLISAEEFLSASACWYLTV